MQFDVVVGGFEYHICLRCCLDWKSYLNNFKWTCSLFDAVYNPDFGSENLPVDWIFWISFTVSWFLIGFINNFQQWGSLPPPLIPWEFLTSFKVSPESGFIFSTVLRVLLEHFLFQLHGSWYLNHVDVTYLNPAPMCNRYLEFWFLTGDYF